MFFVCLFSLKGWEKYNRLETRHAVSSAQTIKRGWTPMSVWEILRNKPFCFGGFQIIHPHFSKYLHAVPPEHQSCVITRHIRWGVWQPQWPRYVDLTWRKSREKMAAFIHRSVCGHTDSPPHSWDWRWCPGPRPEHRWKGVFSPLRRASETSREGAGEGTAQTCVPS